jgi:hypothetical protein
MAATVTANLTTVSLAETTTGWSGTSGQLDTEVYVQGTTTPASYTYQTGKNSLEACTFTPATNLDMSATDTHLYFWMRCDVMPFCEAKTTGTAARSGLCVRVADSAGNYVDWHVAGSDTWGGEWRCFVVDLNHSGTEVYASSGTLDLSDVDVITWYTDNSNSGNIRIIDNTWLDAVRFGTGLTVTGTDFTLADVAADDALLANKYGILQDIDGVIFGQGRITIGSGATTTTLNSDNELFVFKDTFVSSTLYQLNFVGSGNTTDIQNSVFRADGTTDNARFVFDADDTNITFTMAGSSLTRAGLVTFAAGDSITNTVFNDCGQVDPSTATFNTNTLSNYVGTDGALYWNATANTHTLTFINCDRGVEITQTTDQDFVGMDFDDSAGNYDVHLNNGGTSITVANDSNSDGNSYIATGGGVVTFSSSVTLSMICKDESGAVIADAWASIHDQSGSPEVEIMNEQTVAVTGLATTNWTGGAVTGSTWRIRKYGYKPYRASVDIASSDITIPVTLIADPQQT